MRQVPRLVFANACFSAMTSDREEMRKQMTGLAQAFFARGIPNFIGAGWAVDDACAEECARWFYARLFGLRAPDSCDCDSPTLTIGQALKAARKRAFAADPTSSSWGAYQHYGNPTDRLLAYEDVPPGARANAASGRPCVLRDRAVRRAPTATQRRKSVHDRNSANGSPADGRTAARERAHLCQRH